MTPCNCVALGGLYVLVGSLTYPSLGRMFEPSFLGRLLCHEAGLTYRPSSHFQDSVSCLTCSQDSQLLRHPAIDIGSVGPVFLALGCYDPLLLRYAWWSLRPGWLLNLSARMFEPSCFGRLLCLEAGLTSRPLLALPGLCLMPDL